MKYRLYFLANGEVMLCLQGRRCLVRESQPVRYTYHFILALRRSRCASVVADCPVDLETTGNVLSCLNTGRRDSTHPVKPENFTLGTHWFVVPMSQRNFAFYALHTECSIRGVRRGVIGSGNICLSFREILGIRIFGTQSRFPSVFFTEDACERGPKRTHDGVSIVNSRKLNLPAIGNYTDLGRIRTSTGGASNKGSESCPDH